MCVDVQVFTQGQTMSIVSTRHGLHLEFGYSLSGRKFQPYYIQVSSNDKEGTFFIPTADYYDFARRNGFRVKVMAIETKRKITINPKHFTHSGNNEWLPLNCDGFKPMPLRIGRTNYLIKENEYYEWLDQTEGTGEDCPSGDDEAQARNLPGDVE